MVATVDPQGGIAKGGVHKGTVMRFIRIVMGMGTEMRAGHAHPLHGDRARDLQGPDQAHQSALHGVLVSGR